MPDLVLNETKQQAMRHLLGAAPCPGMPLPSQHVLQWLAALIPCDGVVVVFHDSARGVTSTVELGYPPPDDPAPELQGRSPGISVRQRRPGRAGTLAISCPNGPDGFVRVLLGRRLSSFTEDDVALARMITPVLVRLVHERPTPSVPPTMTTQERAVLAHLTSGASNAQIARDLGIAESTVRKHLEHAYRKLGVSGRTAAVARLQERDLPGLDLKERIARVV
ncbi:response regulator transcription factor [Nocardioides sp. GCM10028917]|uniref:helix-turn-helix transcriptional regulator n=1 Tax=Nocardioides sp. GCM10028917 TaxID=3273408 RepID=UPI00360C1D9D